MATSSAVTPTVEPAKELEVIQMNHDEAYLYVSQAISYQEQKNYSLARDMYNKGLEKIDRALNVRCDRPHCTGKNWDNARKLQQKMRKTTQMIKIQLIDLPVSNDVVCPPYTPPEPVEMPPSYDEACDYESLTISRRLSCPNSGVNGNIDHAISGVNSIVDLAQTNGEHNSEVLELFCVPGEVQLFFVSLDGSVTSTSSLSSLHIYQFIEDGNECYNSNRPPAWLQIGSWTYPLIPGHSPALESAYGAFFFPDVESGRDSAVGVILPHVVSQSERKIFQDLLHQLTDLKEEKKSVPHDCQELATTGIASSDSFSDTLSRGIVIGAEYLSAGLVKGASLTSDLIHKGACKAKEKISPDERPIIVDPRIREGLKIAHDASGVALKATGFLVRRLGELTVSLGRQIAPHIRNQGTKLLTSTFKKEEKEAQSAIDGVLTVAAGGLQGFSTVYLGLESAARTLAYSLSSETVNIVDHKYGSEAGEVVGNAVFSIGNLALTTHNVQALGVKSIAKKTAKDAGKAVLKDYVDSSKAPEK